MRGLPSRTAAFTVGDMTCHHCAATLRAAFAAQMPGAEVTIDLPGRILQVAGDPAAAARIIAAAGYTPVPA